MYNDVLWRGHSARDGIEDYFIWGCAVSEVEVDLLTGEKKVIIYICWYFFHNKSFASKSFQAFYEQNFQQITFFKFVQTEIESI